MTNGEARMTRAGINGEMRQKTRKIEDDDEDDYEGVRCASTA